MKILYVTTISNTMSFFTGHINMLLEQGHTVDLACNMVGQIDSGLIAQGCRVYDLKFQRSPLKKENYTAFKELKNIIEEEKYDVIHTHTPIASACVRYACKNMNNIKVIYTAHGFHFFKGAPFKNWLIYYPVERYLAKYTDTLITINEEDFERAKSSFKASNVEYIPGVGLDTKKVSQVVVDKTMKRRELGIPEDGFVILSVGELNKNKNHEAIVKAVAKLNDPNIFYIICGKGALDQHLKTLIKKFGLEGQIKLLGHRRDILEILKVSNVFAFPSYREGLSVALMESMASGLPIICSDIRGNKDLVKHEQGGYLVNPEDIDGFTQLIGRLSRDQELRYKMGMFNREKVSKFDLEIVTERMREIYK